MQEAFRRRYNEGQRHEECYRCVEGWNDQRRHHEWDMRARAREIEHSRAEFEENEARQSPGLEAAATYGPRKLHEKIPPSYRPFTESTAEKVSSRQGAVAVAKARGYRPAVGQLSAREVKSLTEKLLHSTASSLKESLCSTTFRSLVEKHQLTLPDDKETTRSDQARKSCSARSPRRLGDTKEGDHRGDQMVRFLVRMETAPCEVRIEDRKASVNIPSRLPLTPTPRGLGARRGTAKPSSTTGATRQQEAEARRFSRSAVVKPVPPTRQAPRSKRPSPTVVCSEDRSELKPFTPTLDDMVASISESIATSSGPMLAGMDQPVAIPHDPFVSNGSAGGGDRTVSDGRLWDSSLTELAHQPASTTPLLPRRKPKHPTPPATSASSGRSRSIRHRTPTKPQAPQLRLEERHRARKEGQHSGNSGSGAVHPLPTPPEPRTLTPVPLRIPQLEEAVSERLRFNEAIEVHEQRQVDQYKETKQIKERVEKMLDDIAQYDEHQQILQQAQMVEQSQWTEKESSWSPLTRPPSFLDQSQQSHRSEKLQGSPDRGMSAVELRKRKFTAAPSNPNPLATPAVKLAIADAVPVYLGRWSQSLRTTRAEDDVMNVRKALHFHAGSFLSQVLACKRKQEEEARLIEETVLSTETIRR